jgi:PKHD-type hydroxylase
MSTARSLSWHLEPTTSQYFTFMNNVFTKEECEQIIAHGLSDTSLQTGLIGSEAQGKGTVNTQVRKGQLAFLDSGNSELQWIYRRLTDCVMSMNTQMYNYDLTYIEVLQFSIYHPGDFYDQHMDAIKPVCVNNRKLSFSLQLSDSDDYEGSDLEVYVNAIEFAKSPRTQGTVNFFPSYTVHRVTPLIKGTRYALVGWVCGPAWR